MSAPTILLPELAEMLGRAGAAGERYVMRKHRALTAERGFPARLPTGWAWPRKLVEIWIENSAGGSHSNGQGGAGTPPAPGAAPPANDDDPDAAERQRIVAAQTRYLTRRYVGSAP